MTTMFEVIDGNDEPAGEFATLAAARKVARKLGYYAIYHDGRRVEFCEFHPDDAIERDDTPCLPQPWWAVQ